VAALRRPKVIKNNSGEFILSPDERVKTRKKIQAILNIGLVNGTYFLIYQILNSFLKISFFFFLKKKKKRK